MAVVWSKRKVFITVGIYIHIYICIYKFICIYVYMCMYIYLYLEKEGKEEVGVLPALVFFKVLDNPSRVVDDCLGNGVSYVVDQGGRAAAYDCYGVRWTPILH